MNAGMKALLAENLKTLKLSAMKRDLESHVRGARQDKLDYDEFLLNLTDVEVMARQENGYRRRLAEARFPLIKPLETFDFGAAPDLDARLIKELSGCEYVKKSRNVILVGRSGAGKTHLAIGPGIEACKNGITTNMGFGDWTQIFGDASLTAALLDRITHKAHVIDCAWESYRLKETLKHRKGAPK